MKFFINDVKTDPASVTFANKLPAELTEAELVELSRLYYAFELKMAEFEKAQGRTRILDTEEEMISSFKAIKEEENPKDHFILVKDGNTTIGFACWMKSSWFENMGIIENLFLSETYRGQGIGKQLVESAIAAIREAYPGAMISIGVISANIKAKSLYKHLGFSQLVHESYLLK